MKVLGAICWILKLREIVPLIKGRKENASFNRLTAGLCANENCCKASVSQEEELRILPLYTTAMDLKYSPKVLIQWVQQ